jgi:hypothetical protein
MDAPAAAARQELAQEFRLEEPEKVAPPPELR